MRHLLLIFILSLAVFSAKASPAVLDSTSKAAVDAKLAEYVAAIASQPTDVKIQEVDFMVNACKTSELRDYVAVKLYSHYLNSKVMGDEAVAIHLTDSVFVPGKAKFADEMDLMNARVYAEFNRNSLIGAQAPEIVLESPDGTKKNLQKKFSYRYQVYYFYDPDCATCKIETPSLVYLLNKGNYPIDLYAINTMDDRAAWEEYMPKFAVEAPQTKVYHLWDPDVESDFQRLYGVLQTPALFFISPSGVILGRKLDSVALGELLQYYCPNLDYGGDSEKYETIFSALDGASASDYVEAVKYMASRTETMPSLYRQTVGDLLYFMGGKSGEGMQAAKTYLVDSLILGRPDMWYSADDSLKVVGLASLNHDLLSRAAVGSQIADLRLNGTLLKKGCFGKLKYREGTYSLRNLGGSYNFIMFYTEDCPNCKSEKAAAAKLVQQNPKYRVLMVDVDKLEDNTALDTFDLSTLPHIIMIDSGGKVVRKYFSFLDF